MEKRVRKTIGLTALFWRYLLTVGLGIAAAPLVWWAVMMLLMFKGEFVLPAAYAAGHAAETAELLAEEPLTAAQRVSAEAIVRGAERLEAYLARLRTFSAGEDGSEARVSTQLTDLFAVWRAAGDGLCGPQGIHFQAQAPPALTCTVRREAVNRAVLNLLDNAARFAGAGGRVSLTVRAERELLSVTVTDSGPGFSPEALSRAGHGLFTGADSRPQDGHTGWGLCYARQVARDHGGELYLRNTNCGGAAELRWPVGQSV